MATSTPLSILDMHTLIEQDTQALGFYLYDNLETEEVDLQINRQSYQLIDGIVDKFFGRKLKIGTEEGFQVDQVTLDNLRKQHVKDANVSLTTFSAGSKFTLPTGYYHYIKAKVVVAYKCYEDGKQVDKTDTVKLRIVQTEHIDEMLKHPFHKTRKESPLAEIADNTVYIYTNSDFTIQQAILDYIKKPEKVVYAKNIDGTYNSGASVHSDLDDSLQYMLVDMTVLKIAKLKEQPQQKIINLEQETI